MRHSVNAIRARDRGRATAGGVPAHTLVAIEAALGAFGVAPARADEVGPAHALAERLIGGKMADAATIAAVHARTGVGLFIVRGEEGPRGLLAFIMLNARGAGAAARDDFDALAPNPLWVSAACEEPHAIYSWAIAAVDHETAKQLVRGHERLRHAAAPHLPFYCRLATPEGRRLGTMRLGFEPLPGSRSGLFWAPPRDSSLKETAA
ncbi:MAG TPA: hypothetical protein VKU90_07575 [Caulobacteraceae bacterium]|nr:hypothetical protein [Caulobacteraceae bacterium]